MWWWTIHSSETPLNHGQPNPFTFETVLSIPHYNLSAHTFAVHSLPLHQISAVLDLLASDLAATSDLLILDQINQTIVNLEQQINEQHWLATRQFSVSLQHWSASQILQHIHDIKQPDCWRCQIWRQQPTPFAWCSSQLIMVHGSSSESGSSSSSSSSSAWNWYQQMASYPCHSTLILIASTSIATPPSFPQMTTRSNRVYPHNQFKANTSDCLCCLQTIPEEWLWGMAAFPIVVEDPEAKDDIFQQYYHWSINKGRD